MTSMITENECDNVIITPLKLSIEYLEENEYYHILKMTTTWEEVHLHHIFNYVT